MKVINKFFIAVGIACCFFPSLHLHAQQIPADYRLIYEEDFQDKISLETFVATDKQAWRIGGGKEGKALELFKKSNYEPRVRSPHNIIFIPEMKFGSFILEAELQQTGKEYGHRDLCLFFGIKDPSNFYYVHMASQADPNAHNIFLVNDEPRKNVATTTTEGINWGTNEEWHKVRLVRNIETGIIKLFFDDMTTPVMETVDKHLDYGYIGFGSFDDTGKFDNIKIWGSNLEPVKEGFFE